MLENVSQTSQVESQRDATRKLDARTKVTDTLADDLLEGAQEIQNFLFGSRGNRRKTYYLIESKQIPTFRIGNRIYARKSTLLTWITEQEQNVS